MTTMDRKAWIGLLARAPAARLAELMPTLPPHSFLRPPEIGAVMVRGRIGGTGSAFNLGEMTVTRCALRLSSGEVGHAYVQGRSREKARRAAIADALMQSPRAAEVEARLIAPLSAALSQAKDARAAKAAATKVEFFTMVRGED
jgi:alpha-D-ribose 1-methylphosphonate 5-triphosphate synthase subunit PhnG